MTPSQSVTDESLDQLIESARPQLREALKQAIASESVAMLELMKLPLPSGQLWSVTLMVMTEPFAVLAASLLGQGVPAMQQSLMKRSQPAPAAGLGQFVE